MRVTKDVQKRAEEKYKVLENKMKNAEAEREKELKAAQQKLNAAKAKADAFNKKLKQKQQVHQPYTHNPSASPCMALTFVMDAHFFFSLSLSSTARICC